MFIFVKLRLLTVAMLLLFSGGVYPTPMAVQTLNVRPDLTSAQFELPNGLNIVLTVNPAAPLVSVYHWVKVGSLNETPGVTGIAHLFEHMMFRPVHAGEKDFDGKLDPLGGTSNASTSFESTVFVSSVPNENLRGLLKIEADRFKNLKVSDHLLNVERQAVRSEYSTKMDSNPIFDLWTSIYRAGFPGHPYEWMVVGFRADLDKIKASDCNQFFGRYYRPNNTGLFIAGNFDPKPVMAWIETDYGNWARGESSVLPASFKNNGGYTFALGNLHSEAHNLLVGYRIPEERGKKYLLPTLVDHIFFASEFSLAKRRLAFQKDLVSAQVDSFNFEYDSGMIKGLIPVRAGVPYNQVVNELNFLPDDFDRLSDREYEAYIKEFQTNVSENLLRNDHFNSELARYWGRFGDIAFLQSAVNGNIAVTRKEINKFISQYFQKENLVVVANQE